MKNWEVEDALRNQYRVPGERPIGDTFNFGKRPYIVMEADSLEHNGILHSCPCFLCSMNGSCNPDFLFCSGECYWKWRRDGKSVYFKEDKKES